MKIFPEQYLKLQEEEAGEWAGGWADQMLDALYQSVSNLSLDSKIIDLGCNLGRSCFELENKGYINVYGVDLVPSKTRNARKMGLNILTMNIEDLSMFSDQYFDFAFMSHAIEHTLNPSKAIKEMFRIAKAGLIICPLEETQEHKENTPHTSPFYTKEQWLEVLNSTEKPYSQDKILESISMSRLGNEVWTSFK